MHDSRRCWVSMVLVGAAVFISSQAGAAELKGTLSADRKSARVGGGVTLLLTVTGKGQPSSYEIEQAVLPELEHLSLAEVGQRNEVSVGSSGMEFSVAFRYVLEVEEPGEQEIPAVEVKYKKAGEGEFRKLTVPGLTIELTAQRRGRVAVAVLAVLIAAVALALLLMHRDRGGREPPAPPAPGVVPPSAERKSDAAVRALGRLEDARGLKLSGETGAYCEWVSSAVEDYLEEEAAEEIENIAGRLKNLCERVKYGGDEEAEREIDEAVRKAELYFKNRIRKRG